MTYMTFKELNKTHTINVNNYEAWECFKSLGFYLPASNVVEDKDKFSKCSSRKSVPLFNFEKLEAANTSILDWYYL